MVLGFVVFEIRLSIFYGRPSAQLKMHAEVAFGGVRVLKEFRVWGAVLPGFRVLKLGT